MRWKKPDESAPLMIGVAGNDMKSNYNKNAENKATRYKKYSLSEHSKGSFR